MRAPLTVAAAQPVCVAGDVAANAVAHADAIRAAKARLVVFPELSLTGYELDAEPVDDAGVRVAYRKRWLGGAEPARFTAGDGPVVLAVDGWRVGLGICKDTGVFQHVAGIAALDVDLYAAGLAHRPEELPEQEARGIVIARACPAHVVFASFAGPTGDVFTETAGNSAIWSPAGLTLARTGPDPGTIARATLV